MTFCLSAAAGVLWPSSKIWAKQARGRTRRVSALDRNRMKLGCMKIRAALLYVVIIAATVLVAEVLARAYGWTPSRDDYTADRLGQWRYYHSAGGSGDLVPNQDGHWVIWFHRPYHVQDQQRGSAQHAPNC